MVFEPANRTASPHAETAIMMTSSWKTWVVGCLGLVLASLILAPIPAVNETHYLGKARHFANPAWCENDFFLNSPSVHVVFFASTGWLPPFFGMTATALLVRAAGLLVLAYGTYRLSQVLGLSGGGYLSGLWLWPVLVATINVSGEWIVGGAESKVFAYGFLFWAMACLSDDESFLTKSWASLSLLAWSVAWHPIVGLWGALIILGSLVLQSILNKDRPIRSAGSETNVGTRSTGLLTNLCLLAGWLAALWSIAAALQVSLMSGADETVRFQANYLQVYYRLAHHLDPMAIPTTAWLRGISAAGLTFAAWVVLTHSVFLKSASFTRRRAWQLLGWSALPAILLSIAGFLIGFGPRPAEKMAGYAWRMLLLKFYFFRMADVLVPLLLSFSLGELSIMAACRMKRRKSVTPWLLNSFAIVIPAMMLALLVSFAVSRHGSWQAITVAIKQHQDWKATCEWIFKNTPRKTLCFAPTGHTSLKWFAERPEYVSFKDCPQDAAGIVEWNNRLLIITNWLQKQWANGSDAKPALITKAGLKDLHEQTGLQLFITDRLGPFETEPVYQNDTYRIYELP